MGYTVNYYSYSEAADKKKVEADLSTYVEKECWQEGGHMSRPVVVINETDAVAVDSKDIKARFASTENQANDDKSCRFNAASIAKTLIKLMPKYFVDYDSAMNTLYVSTQAAQNYALRLIDGLKISGTPYCVKIV